MCIYVYIYIHRYFIDIYEYKHAYVSLFQLSLRHTRHDSGHQIPGAAAGQALARRPVRGGLPHLLLRVSASHPKLEESVRAPRASGASCLFLAHSLSLSFALSLSFSLSLSLCLPNKGSLIYFSGCPGVLLKPETRNPETTNHKPQTKNEPPHPHTHPPTHLITIHSSALPARRKRSFFRSRDSFISSPRWSPEIDGPTS